MIIIAVLVVHVISSILPILSGLQIATMSREATSSSSIGVQCVETVG